MSFAFLCKIFGYIFLPLSITKGKLKYLCIQHISQILFKWTKILFYFVSSYLFAFSKMSRISDHIRHCLLYEFHLGRSASETMKNICSAYGDDAVSKRTIEKWFAKFRSGNEDLEDEPHARHPAAVSDVSIHELLESEPQLSTRQLAERLSCSKTTVERKLHEMGKVWKLERWLPHELTESQRGLRFSICSSLLSRLECEPFLDRLVTGDEKWVFCVNVTRKRQWISKGEPAKAIPKPELHPHKVMLCVWWNSTGILHWELMPENLTVTAEIYTDQLSRVQAALIEKHPATVNRKGILLLHDNARPHIAKLTMKKVNELRWEVLPHPPYSPDLAPSDFYLFRALQQFVKEKNMKKLTISKMTFPLSLNQSPQTSTKLAFRPLSQDGDKWWRMMVIIVRNKCFLFH